MKKIYFDNAATTPVSMEVLKEMIPYFALQYGNPSATHYKGQEAMLAVSKARQEIADFLGVSSEEIYFTGSATESDNLAILGIVRKFKENNPNVIPHVITSTIEHSAVLNPCQELEKEGVEVSYINVGEDGIVDVEKLKSEIKENTILVSIMYANNEIGTIQPISEIGKIIKEYKKDKTYPLFHTDAVQALNYLDCNINKLGADLLTLSGHKIYGPKGIGALYIKNGVEIKPLIFGGGQEKKIRPGTENVAGIVGLGKAVSEIKNHKENNEKMKILRDKLMKEILEKVPNSKLNGCVENRLPNNVNVSFDGINGKNLVMIMDKQGIAVSAGSACHTQSPNPSHVLKAIGLSDELAFSSLRITLGIYNTAEEVDFVLERLLEIIKSL